MDERERIAACRQRLITAISEANLTPAVAVLLLENVIAAVDLAACRAGTRPAGPTEKE